MPLHDEEQSATPREIIARGAVIPAHPLALTADRTLDERRQRALTRYYVDAGAGGVAVGVHTTQFAIRAAGHYPEVLRMAADEATSWSERPVALIAGVTGRAPQALDETHLALDTGYHAVLLNLAAWRGEAEADILAHCRRIAAIAPVIGFALLPAVGGMHLSYDFWRAFAEIDNVIAIKMAPFDRYRTIDIVRAVVDARAEERIALYTGNDDHIVLDLLQPFTVRRDDEMVTVHIVGGLLGQWSVWTRRAVEMFESIRRVRGREEVPSALLALDSQLTDANRAIYDALNDFAGCIPGCLEVLRRQGLTEGSWCLDPTEVLSEGQSADIDRVYEAYPNLNDDEFVVAHRAAWLA